MRSALRKPFLWRSPDNRAERVIVSRTNATADCEARGAGQFVTPEMTTFASMSDLPEAAAVVLYG